MKTKENDRRVQRTKRTLREALIALILEKGYDEVTVQHIIDRADVGRSTFYAHFENKDKLLLSGFDKMQEVFSEANGDQSSSGENKDFPFNSLKIFEHAQEHRRIYSALAGKTGGDLFLKQMFRGLHDICRAGIQLKVSKENDILADASAHFFAASLVSMLTFWLDNNLPLTPKEIDELFKQLTLPGLRNILTKYVEPSLTQNQ